MQDAVHLVSVTPTIDTSIYASGDAMHAAPMEFDASMFRDAGGFILDQVLIVDNDKEVANVDLILFSADLADQTINNPFDPSDAELATAIAAVSVTTHFSFNDNSLSVARDLGIPIRMGRTATTGTIYGFLVARATPTYTAATDLKVTLGLRAVR